MAIKQKLLDTETLELPQDVDDLDKAYILKMKEDGIDDELMDQFVDLMSMLKDEE